MVLDTNNLCRFSDAISRAATEVCEEFYDTLTLAAGLS